MALLIMGFDQSLIATGVAVIRWDGAAARPFSLLYKSTIRTEPKPGLKGYRDTIPRGDSIARGVRAAIREVEGTYGLIDVYAHEMPAVPVGKMMRVDASIIASVAVRTTVTVMYPHTPILMVQGQHMKSSLTGFSAAEKAEVRAAVVRHIGEVKSNEHVFDAAGIAISTVLDGLAQEAVG